MDKVKQERAQAVAAALAKLYHQPKPMKFNFLAPPKPQNG